MLSIWAKVEGVEGWKDLGISIEVIENIDYGILGREKSQEMRCGFIDGVEIGYTKTYQDLVDARGTPAPPVFRRQSASRYILGSDS